MRLLTLFLLLAPYLLHPGGSAPAEDWPQFRGSSGLSGTSSASIPDQLKVKWTYDCGEAIQSSAAIHEGKVFVGSVSGELTALDLESGALLWKYEASDAIGESSPCVEKGIVYIGDLAGSVHAVSVQDGKGIWTHETEGELKASPVVSGDRVLIGSYDGLLYCFSAQDGALLWQVQTDGPVNCTAGIVDGIAYISGCDGMLRGVRVADGEQVVSVDIGAYTGASPALANNMVVFGTFENRVVGVDLLLKSVRWSYEHPEKKFPFYSSAALAAGKAVVGGRDKSVHCLEAETGKLLWTFATKGRVDSSPAVAAGRVYVGSKDGRFYVLDLETGKKLWEFLAGSPISASPALAAGRVILGAEDGILYCFGANE